MYPYSVFAWVPQAPEVRKIFLISEYSNARGNQYLHSASLSSKRIEIYIKLIHVLYIRNLPAYLTLPSYLCPQVYLHLFYCHRFTFFSPRKVLRELQALHLENNIFLLANIPARMCLIFQSSFFSPLQLHVIV